MDSIIQNMTIKEYVRISLMLGLDPTLKLIKIKKDNWIPADPMFWREEENFSLLNRVPKVV